MYIDSTAAEGTLRRGYSTSFLLCAIAGAFWFVAARHQIAVWIGHVPSALNPADSLSRKDVYLAASIGAVQLEACFPHPAEWNCLLRHPLAKATRSKVE